jgi:hypothetical protein
MSAHTKGTWRQGGDGSAVFSGARLVASVFPMADENAEELKANVRLIAAAPELLKELQELVEAYADGEPNWKQIVSSASAAIAKATGEQA